MDNVLTDFPGEGAAREEIDILGCYLAELPAMPNNYGRVHYDFESDNVFYDKEDGCYYVIDFDDAMYHWFVLDIEQSIDSLMEVVRPGSKLDAKTLFIQGYRSVMPVDESMLAIMPVFRRYIDLYGYVRILRGTKDQWAHEPDWVVTLRKKLVGAMEKRRKRFGTSISV
jgi:Ser/Thr protein kinase RdoA (MazF antagonist)